MLRVRIEKSSSTVRCRYNNVSLWSLKDWVMHMDKLHSLILDYMEKKIPCGEHGSAGEESIPM